MDFIAVSALNGCNDSQSCFRTTINAEFCAVQFLIASCFVCGLYYAMESLVGDRSGIWMVDCWLENSEDVQKQTSHTIPDDWTAVRRPPHCGKCCDAVISSRRVYRGMRRLHVYIAASHCGALSYAAITNVVPARQLFLYFSMFSGFFKQFFKTKKDKSPPSHNAFLNPYLATEYLHWDKLWNLFPKWDHLGPFWKFSSVHMMSYRILWNFISKTALGGTLL
jgi:hypothetical protein